MAIQNNTTPLIYDTFQELFVKIALPPFPCLHLHLLTLKLVRALHWALVRVRSMSEPQQPYEHGRRMIQYHFD